MAEIGADDGGAIGRAAVEIIARLDARLPDITKSVQQLVMADIAELRGEEQLQQLLADTVEANIDTFFSAIRHGIPVEFVQVPTAAIEYARRLAQRDVSANALVRAYRLGHQGALKAILEEIRAAALDPQLSLDLFDVMSTVSFGYIDQVSQAVVVVYQQARERWLETRNSLRTAKVRELLAGGEMDLDAMTTTIRYPLRRVHLAVVLWCVEPEDKLAAMERQVHKYAEVIASPDAPLFISVDRVTAWAWITVPADIVDEAAARIRDVAPAEGIYVAVGTPLQGADGFRHSHRHALDARAVAVASNLAQRQFTAFSDHGISLSALVGSDIDAAAVWTREVLGPLAGPTDSDERLRETLYAFLRSGSSYKAAAEEQHLHTNSVKYRVHRAIERRGRPIDDDRLDVEVALLLCSQFGERLLQCQDAPQ
ncbi:PucR family transcriptional regulator [Mycobacterium sp. MAA66]|uniref:PucR family transcriptional regulator n=1 Tax=Mycobacterium sp. MAA66 TaxID=3156297 RepID=UPI0035171613